MSQPGPSSQLGSRAGSKSTRESRGSSAAVFRDTVCVFWLAGRCYAISAELVGEIVHVDNVAPVPLAPPAVLGVFNLRGTPVALVDTSRALDLPGAGALAEAPTVLVLRRGSSVLAGLAIERTDSVVSAEQGKFTPRDWHDDHAAVSGFLEVPGRRHVITIFDSAAVIERLLALRFR